MIAVQDPIRQKMEQCILGACVQEPYAFAEVANILQAGNFIAWDADNDHPLIWKAMSELWPHTPIDSATLAYHIKAKHNRNLVYCITTCMNRVASTAHLVHHSLVLLECDMRGKFLELLRDINNEIHEDETVHKAALLECYDIVDTKVETDIVLTIRGLTGYLEKILFPDDHLKRLQEFAAHIDVKSSEIKRIKTIDHLLIQLLNYGNYSCCNENKAAMSDLAEIIGILYFKKNITTGTLKKIQALKQDLL
jgi:DnaB helicase-like protein